MKRNSNLKKCMSSIIAIMFMLSLVLVQAPAAFAETLQTPVADTSNDAVVLSVTDDVSRGTVGDREPGGDISNSVFYIAVKDSASGETKYYYYTRAELESYETQQAYTYDDHSVIKTVTCKGALLTDLLADLNGVTISDAMIVQYAEEDGYHADAATEVINSNYKDTIESLTKQTVSGSGSTKNAMRPIVTYAIHEEYASPDANNINDAEGVFKDADNNSGYLRVYRDTGGANSAVMKYMMGIVVSTDGALLSGSNGCVVTSVSDTNSTLKVRDDITIKGLVPGMQYAVKAPKVISANLASGQTSPRLITVGSGEPAAQVETFVYTEDTYFYVKNTTTGTTTNYTYRDLIAMHKQVPDAGTNTAPYGYSRPMYYRYNGVWLSDLAGGLSGSNYSIKLVAKDGTKTDITSNIALYFAAYNNTESKTNTNIPEGKRVTVAYDDAKVIIPGTGENITGSGATDYTTAGKDVDVLMAAAEGLEITVVGDREPGGDISNSVFYIAVKDSASGETKYYYYTRAELEAYETQQAYTYDDHSVIKTVTCKGALLTDLLADLGGVTLTDDMVVQYAEEDGYHANAATAVINSDYKDTIESLSKQTVSGSGSTKNAMRPIVTYAIHEEYASPDANNVNDAEGVFKDADNNSGYLRVYRDTAGANSAVMKYMMGVVVSTDGALLSGSNGCVITSVSDTNSTLKVRDDITIKGLVPGMQYAVKAPKVISANLASGQTSPRLITVGSGEPAEQVITFVYTEETYFYVKNSLTNTTTNYTYRDLIAMHKQVPDATTNTAPYGYSRPMYYRYNGVWLSDLVSGLNGNYTIKLLAKDGTKTDITSNIALYFAAYNNTESKTNTNIPENKRVTVAYDDAKVIIPGTGENVTGSGATDYTTAGKDVDVLVAAAEGLEISTSGGGSSPTSGGSSGGGGSSALSGQLVKSTGATVSKNGVTVVIPEGAVSSDTRVTVVKAGSSGLTVDSDSTLISDVYEITKNKDGDFAKDVTITLPFAKSKADQTKDELTLCCWNGSKWVELDNIEVNWSAGTVSGTVNHLTKFAVLAKTTAPVIPAATVEAQPETKAAALNDIGGHWANAAILAMTAKGVVNGYQDGSFKPDQSITRAEFATMLAKAFNLSSSGNKVFDDTAGHWAQGYIAAASDAGILSGSIDNQFNPDELMTREQMAVMIVKAAKAATSSETISFKDKDSISSWAQDAVASAIAAELMSGCPDQTFGPQDNTTRAEAASVLARALGQK